MRKVLSGLLLFSFFGYSQISIVPYSYEIYDDSIQSKSSMSFYQFENNRIGFNQVNSHEEGGFSFYPIQSGSSNNPLNSFSSSSLSVFDYIFNREINGGISMSYYLFPENELKVSHYSFNNLQSNSVIQNDDDDNDGVPDDLDQCPDTRQGVNVDIRGCEIFNLPQNNYSIEVISSSCRGENDGSISISVEDEDLNYTLRVNGENPVDLNSSEGYQQTLSNLPPGTYQLCFTVEGESGYNQCFDVNITEPAPLSASSRVDKENKTIRFNLSGSEQYTINHNGTDYVFGSSSPEIDLVYGLNFIEVKTDKYCQGTYTKEVFISEKVEYYPNPTRDLVNLYLHGQDSSIDLQLVDRDGNIKEILCKEIGLNRKIKVDFSSYPEGVYMIRLLSKTIDKTVKIIKE